MTGTIQQRKSTPTATVVANGPTFLLPILAADWPAIRAQLTQQVNTLTTAIHAGDESFNNYATSSLQPAAPQVTPAVEPPEQPRRKRRKLSAAARKRISEAVRRAKAAKATQGRGAKPKTMTAGAAG